MSEPKVKIENSRGQHFWITEYDYEIDKGTEEFVELRISKPLNHTGSVGRTETMRVSKDAMKQVSKSYAQSQWISVEDGLPDAQQRVLVIQDPTKTATAEALFSVFDGEDFAPPSGDGRWIHITHWQPLPQPPK